MQLLLLIVLVLAPSAARAQSPVRYEIAFPHAAHHEAEITVVFPDLNPGPLEIRMSRTSPGRYALHEFAKNVYKFRATGVDGRPVKVSHPELHQWTVAGHGGEVRVTYTLYGDRADGTYTGIDRSHGHLNMPATFVWARGLEARPIELRVHPPEGAGWRVATQLQATEDPYLFRAPDLAYFLDSPTEVSDFWETAWELEGQTIRVALHHDGTEAEATEYARRAALIVRAQRDIYGELPRFDYGTYTFLACYLPWVSGDGMEHRNSTVLTSTSSLATRMDGLLGTVAHEFFHAWNVERIRPSTLEPFDFEAANVSRELWFGEGFTSYYDGLSMWRAGLVSDADFVRSLGGSVSYVTDAPGRRYFSAVEMSMQAPFVDAAVSVDPTNRANTFISYYTWGSVIGLGLDLTLRTSFRGLSLDDLMREMWARHGTPEIPYTVEDVEAALAHVTGDAAFARDFFQRYVRGTEVPDFARLLDAAGISLELSSPGEASLGGVRFREGEGGVVVVGNTLVGSPLYEAGLDRGDLLVSLDGREVGTPEDVEELVSSRAPGDTVQVVFESRGRRLESSVVLAEHDALQTVLQPEPSPGQLEFLARWKRGGRR